MPEKQGSEPINAIDLAEKGVEGLKQEQNRGEKLSTLANQAKNNYDNLIKILKINNNDGQELFKKIISKIDNTRTEVEMELGLTNGNIPKAKEGFDTFTKLVLISECPDALINDKNDGFGNTIEKGLFGRKYGPEEHDKIISNLLKLDINSIKGHRVDVNIVNENKETAEKGAKGENQIYKNFNIINKIEADDKNNKK